MSALDGDVLFGVGMMDLPPSATVFSPWVEFDGRKLDFELLVLPTLLTLLILVFLATGFCTPCPCFEADLSLSADVLVWWILIEDPLLLVLWRPDLGASSKLLWLPTDRGDRDGAVYRRLDAVLPGEICLDCPANGILDMRLYELFVLFEYVEVVELVSPMSISTIGMFLTDDVPSSFVNVPCRTSGALGLIMLLELFERGEMVLIGDFVKPAELDPDR